TDKFLKANISGDEAKKIYDDIINEISEKKNINISNSIKINPNKILKAVEQGDIDYLNENNVNKIFDNYGWTPLMSAACCGNESIVKFLLELDANKQYKNKCGLTALQLAKKKNNFKDR
ncbi:GSCOCG00009362001-RA-CDS, partial [Cotesia congregata]